MKPRKADHSPRYSTCQRGVNVSIRSLWDLRGRHTGGHKIHGSIVHKGEKAKNKNFLSADRGPGNGGR